MTQIQRVDSPLLTKAEAADFLRVSVRKLENEIAAGAIAACRIGTRVLIPRNGLVRYVESKTAFEHVADREAVLSTA